MIDASMAMGCVTLGVVVLLCFGRRAEIAEWLAVRLLAYRDSVTHRSRSIAMWAKSLESEQSRVVLLKERER